MVTNSIFIAGANGYIGSRLAKFFSEKGFAVYGLCFPALPDSDVWKSFFTEIIVGDIRDSAIQNKICSLKFETFIQLISLDQYQCNVLDIEKVNEINVLPTWKLLDSLKNGGLKNYLYFSTVQVYGKLEPINITEANLPAPQNIYGLTHLLTENICSYFNKTTNVNCTIVRLSNSYGSPVHEQADCWKLVINELCKSAFENQTIKLLSDGSPLRNFIHYTDLCNAVEIVLNTSKSDDNIYHVCSEFTYAILELAEMVKKCFSERFNKKVTVFNNAGFEIDDFSVFKNNKSYTLDNSKIKTRGFVQKFNLETGINEIFDYLTLKNGK